MSDSTLIPQFQDPKLQQAAESSHQSLVDFQEHLNTISEDIKALEAYLRKMNVCVPLRSNSRRSHKEDDSWKFDERVIFEKLITIAPRERRRHQVKLFAESLLWDLDAHENYRILYECLVADGEVEFRGENMEDPVYYPDLSTLKVEVKPLLETKVEVRVEMYNALHSLLQNFEERYPGRHFIEKMKKLLPEPEQDTINSNEDFEAFFNGRRKKGIVERFVERLAGE